MDNHEGLSGDEVQDAAQRQQAGEERQRRRDAEDLKWMLSDARGRRLMWKWLGESGLYRSSFTGNSHTFFNEGMRNFGLQRIAEIHEHAPEAYFKMLKEQA